jgi:hypothetical protein
MAVQQKNNTIVLAHYCYHISSNITSAIFKPAKDLNVLNGMDPKRKSLREWSTYPDCVATYHPHVLIKAAFTVEKISFFVMMDLKLCP